MHLEQIFNLIFQTLIIENHRHEINLISYDYLFEEDMCWYQPKCISEYLAHGRCLSYFFHHLELSSVYENKFLFVFFCCKVSRYDSRIVLVFFRACIFSLAREQKYVFATWSRLCKGYFTRRFSTVRSVTLERKIRLILSERM